MADLDPFKEPFYWLFWKSQKLGPPEVVLRYFSLGLFKEPKWLFSHCVCKVPQSEFYHKQNKQISPKKLGAFSLLSACTCKPITEIYLKYSKSCVAVKSFISNTAKSEIPLTVMCINLEQCEVSWIPLFTDDLLAEQVCMQVRSVMNINLVKVFEWRLS